jgi:hypothetical protein
MIEIATSLAFLAMTTGTKSLLIAPSASSGQALYERGTRVLNRNITSSPFEKGRGRGIL